MRIIKYVVFSCKKKENTNQEEMESYDIYIYILRVIMIKCSVLENLMH